METRELVQTALLVAVSVAVGYLLAPVPNFELISACIFTAGVLQGVRRGAVVGALAELLYSSLNPYGAAPLPLLVSQVLGMTAIGVFTGGFNCDTAVSVAWTVSSAGVGWNTRVTST